jgi:HD-GYP domain-containing protein (c-di-GMP phosphodiesterase class II)
VSRLIKHVCLVIVVQSGCLAVGLWVQHRYVETSVRQTAEDEAWSDIQTSSAALSSVLGDVTLSNWRQDAFARRLLVRRLAAHRPRDGDWMIVDRQWRLLVSGAQREQASRSTVSPGARVEWSPSTGAGNDPVRPLKGRLVLPDGLHIAVARALGDPGGFLVIHYPLRAIEARSASLVRSLPVISILTFVWTCPLLAIAVYVLLARLHDDMERERGRSSTDALRQTQNLIRTRDAVIFGLAKLTEFRDPDTGDHLERISLYSRTLSSALRDHPKFREHITPAFIRLIGISSALHDIGKVGVEDRVLLKHGPLTTEERACMQVHTTIGGDCLRVIERRLGSSNFLQMAREITCCHHESWDGTGYPNGLAGTEIPLSARIVAIADIYDALSSRRVYKEAFPHEKCVKIMREEAGKKLDPDLMEAWLKLECKFHEIARKFRDNAGETERHPPVELGPAEDVEHEIKERCVVLAGRRNESVG